MDALGMDKVLPEINGCKQTRTCQNTCFRQGSKVAFEQKLPIPTQHSLRVLQSYYPESLACLSGYPKIYSFSNLNHLHSQGWVFKGDFPYFPFISSPT